MHPKIFGEYIGKIYKISFEYFNMPREINIRIAGTGGQGVIKAGLVLAEAFALDGKNVVQIQSYGPEARGGVSRTDIVVSDEEIDFPGLRRIDYLLVLHDSAYRKYYPQVDGKTHVIYDSSLVNARRGLGFPFTETSIREFGSPLFTNMIAIGALAAMLGLQPEKVEVVIAKRIRNAGENIKAFRIGFEMGSRLVKPYILS